MNNVRRNEPPRPTVYTPRIDIQETKDGLVLRADLPGVAKDGLDLVVEDNVLKIFGRTGPSTPADAKPIFQEYAPGVFFRSFILGDEVDVEQNRAELEAGVLTIELPRSARPKARRIEVTSDRRPAKQPE
ncbi:MAG: Hsp20/alpha crystallin family protein [Planctomycetia bacterium]